MSAAGPLLKGNPLTASESARVFGAYAQFYDALYADKDYDAECRFLETIFRAHGVEPGASVLDLGCGTGGHVIPLARAGYRVTGIDRSEEMVRIATDKTATAGAAAELLVGDVRTVALDRTFDAVISMFAVMGYQLANEDLAAAFASARAHLKPGGLFTFDAWFGPAVLSERPGVTRKSAVLGDGSHVERVATPTLDVVAQTVRVDYALEHQSASAPRAEVAESHTMRFLFPQEVAYFLQIAGFTVVDLMPFMRPGETPTAHDWNVTWVARAV